MSARRLKAYALIYFAVVGPLSSLHLLQGSSLGCVSIWALCIAFAFAFVYHGGLHNTMVWMSLLFIARYVGLASPLKIALGQPLDSYLHTPVETYLLTLCTIVEIYVAYRLVDRMRLRRVVFRDLSDLRTLSIFSCLCFIIGSIAFFLTSFRAKEDFELGGFRVYSDCIYAMGIIGRTAYVLRKSQGRTYMEPFLGVMLAGGVFFAVLANTKSTAFSCMLAYLLTIIGLRRAVPWRVLVLGAFCMWLLIGVLTPVIQTLRTQDANYKTMSERFEDIVDYAYHGTLSEARENVAIYGELSEEITSYFGPLGMFHATVARIGLVKSADPIKRGIDINGSLGSPFLLWGFTRLVPRILNPEKDMDSPADVICWHAGVQDRRVINRQAIGIVAGSYAIAGWIGVAIIPLALYTIFFFLQRLWSDTSSANIFAVFFVVNQYNRFVEVDPISMIDIVFRCIELEMIGFLVLIVASKLVLGALLAGRTHPAPRLAGAPFRSNSGKGLGT